MAELISSGGAVSEFTLPVNGSDVGRMRVLQTAVEGQPEITILADGRGVITSKTVKKIARTLNHVATKRCGENVYGNAIICTTAEMKRISDH